MPDAPARILKVAASLRLTVACLGLAMVLVLAGTLAQVDEGLFLAQERYFRSFWVWISFDGFSLPILPGGYLLGSVLVVNLLAAHLSRFRRSWSKLGIHLIHLGLLLLILGHFASDFLDTESQMRLDLGQTSNWSESVRESELVFLNGKDGELETVSIPTAGLRPGRVLEPPGLPYDLRVIAWHDNAVLHQISQPPANTRGAARQFEVHSRARETRLDRRDLPALEFELLDRDSGTSLGYWLAPLQLDQTQNIVNPDEISWQFQLRQRRFSQPFQLSLEEFIHEKYPGSDISKHFASRLLLHDEDGDDPRPVLIQMNQPLRIAGRTIYQASFDNDDRTSVLQVVENPGWITPYLACSLVVLGLLIQFGFQLVKALRSPRRKRTAPEPPASRIAHLLPAGAALASLVVLGFSAANSLRPQGQLAGIPVQAHGRIQALETLARETLTLLAGRPEIKAPDGQELKALDWLHLLISDPAAAETLPVFRIVHPQILALVGQKSAKPLRLSFDQLRPSFTEIRQQAQSVAEGPEKDPYRRAILQLDNALHQYAALRLSFHAANDSSSLHRDVETFAPLIPSAIDQAEAWKSGLGYDQEILNLFVPRGRSYREAEALALAQPAWPDQPITDKWISLPGAMLASAAARQAHPAPALYAAVFANTTDPAAAIEALAQAVRDASPKAFARARSEALFHSLNLFGISRILYLLAFALAATSWLLAPQALRHAAWRIAALAFFLTTIALIWRIALLGRPPVTNLHSSALFVAWVGVALGLLTERFTRDGIVTAAAAALGFASLLIAHHIGGDSMGVLVAVLDSNFWLSTHVITITIGYASTFLAGFLGIIFLSLRAFGSRFNDESQTRLASVIYGILCFSLLFSFTGTILGGIWADQSWGRFWGWDPKENGALLIVLWNALILHARWGGFLRRRGLAACAVLGNIVTAFSWFGTNLLGIGLHSYGFTDSGFRWLVAFAVFQGVIALLTVLPSAKTLPPSSRK